VSPANIVIFAYLGLAFPVLLAINVALLAYWMMSKDSLFAFLIAISIIVCWKPVSAYIPFHPLQEATPNYNTIKVLSYNVMGFNYQVPRKNKPNPIIQYVQQSNADIVCMQEYVVGQKAYFLTQKNMEELLQMYPYHYQTPLVDYKRYTVGLAIYSKFPILKSWKIPYDSNFNGSTAHVLQVGNKTLTVVNNHLESFKLTTEDRSKYAEFVKNVGPETFDGLRETVHRRLGAAFKIRAQQADIIAKELKKIKTDYTIVCGDFNDTPVSYAHRTIQGKLKDAFADAGNGPGTTYNQNFFWFRIDHILHSTNMKAYQTTVDKAELSDHYPVWCYLELR
jgi:endonuclease/exonuclease/phosphatase family metal-dependent hydrolase